MNWHELKDGRSIAIDSTTFYVKAKQPSIAEVKQTLLFYPKKTIFFHIDDRKTSVQFDGHSYHFETQEKREAFIQSLTTCFPATQTIGVHEMVKHPYRPQIAALIVLNSCFWIGLVANSSQGSYSIGHGNRANPGHFIDLLAAIPYEVLISVYVIFSVVSINRLNQTSKRLEHETIFQITQP